jgi:hypothetical protein
MAKERGEVVVIEAGFDYSPLQPKTAEKVKEAAERIRQTVKRSIEDVITVGKDLLAVKEELDHGQFGRWLKAEFGWGERMAQNFMSVAERFGPKSEIIAELTIQPTAAYLLAAPSVPDEAREKAISMAEGGDKITTKVARKIVADARKKKRSRRHKPLATEMLGSRLGKVLERYKERWNQKELADLARQLREFADSLEDSRAGGRKKGG